jgi:hypothetical protein
MALRHRAPTDLEAVKRRLPLLTAVPEEELPQAEDAAAFAVQEEDLRPSLYYLHALQAFPPIPPEEYHALRFTPKQWEQRNSPGGMLHLQRQRQARLDFYEAKR